MAAGGAGEEDHVHGALGRVKGHSLPGTLPVPGLPQHARMHACGCNHVLTPPYSLQGTYLLLEKLRQAVYRRLLRRVYLINAEQQPAKAAQIPLPLFQQALAVQVGWAAVRVGRRVVWAGYPMAG